MMFASLAGPTASEPTLRAATEARLRPHSNCSSEPTPQARRMEATTRSVGRRRNARPSQPSRATGAHPAPEHDPNRLRVRRRTSSGSLLTRSPAYFARSLEETSTTSPATATDTDTSALRTRLTRDETEPARRRGLTTSPHRSDHSEGGRASGSPALGDGTQPPSPCHVTIFACPGLPGCASSRPAVVIWSMQGRLSRRRPPDAAGTRLRRGAGDGCAGTVAGMIRLPRDCPISGRVVWSHSTRRRAVSSTGRAADF